MELNAQPGGPRQRYGSTLPVASVRACVVYDAATGHIHHRHTSVTLEGGRVPTDEELHDAALRLARNGPRPPEGELRVLHVEHEAMLAPRPQRVDLVALALVPREP